MQQFAYTEQCDLNEISQNFHYVKNSDEKFEYNL